MASIAILCVGVAVMWPGARDVLAQIGVYDQTYLGCATNKAGDFVVVMTDGPESITGGTCAAALNNLPAGCEVKAEGFSIDKKGKSFGTILRLECN